jgi:hypothetical protein
MEHDRMVIHIPVLRMLGRDLGGSLNDDIRRTGLGPPPADRPEVTDQDVAHLPEVVQRYLGRMGVIGRPPVATFRAKASGQFRMRRGQRFMPCAICQYDSAAPVTRLFHMRIDLFGLIPMVGSDRYVGGEGRMLGKLLGVVTVADGAGPEFDTGELTTFLNDAVLLAPSMLLGLEVEWTALGDDRFAVALTDSGRTVSAEVSLDAAATPVDFVSTDRWADLPGGLARARWSTPVGGWVRRTDGRLVPTEGKAIWHLPDGDLTYARLRFRPYDIDFDV